MPLFLLRSRVEGRGQGPGLFLFLGLVSRAVIPLSRSGCCYGSVSCLCLLPTRSAG